MKQQIHSGNYGRWRRDKIRNFVDDFTAFLLNDTSVAKFLELLENFGECSGLRINQK